MAPIQEIVHEGIKVIRFQAVGTSQAAYFERGVRTV